MHDDFLDFLANVAPKVIAAIALGVAVKNMKATEKEKRFRALDAFRQAATATNAYYAGQKDDKAREQEIGGLWLTCADRVKDYDERLADRFMVKRNYWVSPVKWTDEEVKVAQIGLEAITRDAEISLNPPKVTKRAKR